MALAALMMTFSLSIFLYTWSMSASSLFILPAVELPSEVNDVFGAFAWIFEQIPRLLQGRG